MTTQGMLKMAPEQKSVVKLRSYQQEALDAILDAFMHRLVARQLVSLPTGCHVAGQGILMFDGSIKAVEDVAIGDLLMGPDSRPRTVKQLHRGEDAIVEIRPTKGQPWRVNRDHILTLVRTQSGTTYPSQRGGALLDVSVRDWMRWSRTAKHIHKLIRTGVDFPVGRALGLLDPYVLGILLGDGSLTAYVGVTMPDPEVVAAVGAEAERHGEHLRRAIGSEIDYVIVSGRGQANPIRDELRRLGLFGKGSGDKFVPRAYLVASREERFALLAGLMDSDGSLSRGGFDFVSKSRRLAEDTLFLARSLGLAAYMREKRVAGHSYWRLSISGNLSAVPTRVPRKQATPRSQKKDVLRTGFTIVETDEVEPYYGFALDGDGRYLLDDFTVTHNSGKTFLAAHLVKEVGFRTVFMVHRDELATQSMKALHEINPNLTIGLVKAQSDETGAHMMVVSAQTLARQNRLDRVREAIGDEPLLLISDEAHHDRAESRERIIRTLDPALLVGLTATPQRGDKLGLDQVYEEIVYHLPMLDLIHAGMLADLKGLQIKTSIDLDGVRVRYGEFVEKDLAGAVNTSARNKVIVESWQEHASDRQRTVAFCVDVRHAIDLRDSFRAAGIRSETVLGETPAEERAEILEKFSLGEIPVLTNCMVLTEGYDEPAIDCILMARPTKSPGLYIQCVGRGARTADGKDDCLVIDLVDNTSRHSLISFPTLTGVEQTEESEALTPGEPRSLLDIAEQQQLFKERRAIEVDLFGRSPVLWQRPSDIVAFFAPAGQDDREQRYVVVVPEGSGFLPVLLRAPRDRYRKATTEPLFDRAVDIEIAKGIADEAVEHSPLTKRDAFWRTKKDRPSEGQLKFARSLGIRAAEQMTKAEVSDRINERMFIRHAKSAGLDLGVTK